MTDKLRGPAEVAGGSTSPTVPALVEDVLLLLFQPDSGTIAGENTLFYVLAGAVVADLALTGKVEARPSGRSSSKVHAIGTTPPTDEVLEPAWSYVAEKPRDVHTVLAAIGPPLREPVLNRLVGRGDLDRRTRKVFGVFTTTRLTLGGPRRPQLLDRVRATLVDGAQPGVRAAARIALLSASGTLPQFHPEIPWSAAVYTRGKEYEEGDWGASAAASAVTRSMTAAVVSAVVAAAR